MKATQSLIREFDRLTGTNHFQGLLLDVSRFIVKEAEGILIP